MQEKTKTILERKNIRLILSTFLYGGDKVKFMPKRFRDIQKDLAFGKATKNKRSIISDRQIDLNLKKLLEMKILKKEGKEYLIREDYYSFLIKLIKRTLQKEVLDAFEDKAVLLSGKLTFYGIDNSKGIYSKEVKRIKTNMKKQIDNLFQIKKAQKIKKLQRVYLSEYKPIKSKRLKIFLKKRRKAIIEILASFNLSDESIKRFLPGIQIEGKNKLNDKEKINLGEFVVRVMEKVRNEFSPMEIVAIYRTSRNVAKELFEFDQFRKKQENIRLEKF